MDRYEIIKKITNPILCMVLVFIALVVGISYGIINNIRNEKQEYIISSGVVVLQDSATGDIKVLNDKNISETSGDKTEVLAVNTEEAEEKIKKYYENRYDFEGDYFENKDKILSNIKSLVTQDFYAQVESALKTNQQGDKETKGNTCKVLKIYQNNSASKPNVFCCIAEINSDVAAYRITMKDVDGSYLIDKEEFLGIKLKEVVN